MITVAGLRRVAKARLRDAKALLRARRYDGAVYLVGYAVEIALKARTCISLRWPTFPESQKEFEGLQSFKTHKLSVLLHLSGREETIKGSLFAEWSAVASWDPETRYRPAGSSGKMEAELMISSAEAKLKAL